MLLGMRRGKEKPGGEDEGEITQKLQRKAGEREENQWKMWE